MTLSHRVLMFAFIICTVPSCAHLGAQRTTGEATSVPAEDLRDSEEIDERIQKLVDQLRYSQNDYKRQLACAELWRMGWNGEEIVAQAVPQLIDALRDDNIQVRYHATTTLGVLAIYADDAFPKLVEIVLSDADTIERMWAIDAVAGFVHRSDDVVPILVGELDKGGVTEPMAAMALAKLGPAAKDAVPALIRALGSTNIETPRMAIAALGLIGPEARAALPALEKLKSGRSLNFGDRADLAIEMIGTKDVRQRQELATKDETLYKIVSYRNDDSLHVWEGVYTGRGGDPMPILAFDIIWPESTPRIGDSYGEETDGGRYRSALTSTRDGITLQVVVDRRTDVLSLGEQRIPNASGKIHFIVVNADGTAVITKSEALDPEDPRLSTPPLR